MYPPLETLTVNLLISWELMLNLVNIEIMRELP